MSNILNVVTKSWQGSCTRVAEPASFSPVPAKASSPPGRRNVGGRKPIKDKSVSRSTAVILPIIYSASNWIWFKGNDSRAKGHNLYDFSLTDWILFITCLCFYFDRYLQKRRKEGKFAVRGISLLLPVAENAVLTILMNFCWYAYFIANFS